MTADRVAALIEIAPAVAVVRLSAWSPPLAAAIKAAGASWHRHDGPVPGCWTLPPADVYPLA